jgi:hypothetical protein
MSGLLGLNTAAGLREKLRRDLERMKAEVLNVDAAFNFFVTAEHMLDWVYPKKSNEPKRKNARQQSVLLRVCSHLANGAKHFEVENPHHDSVSSSGLTVTGGLFPRQLFPLFPDALAGRSPRLVVNLKGDAATQLGATIGIIELAEKVMDYWDNHTLM